MSRRSLGLVALALVAGCNVTPAELTGGADLPARGECPRGLAVVSSDFQSSEVALLEPGGAVASRALVSSASSEASGLAAFISGDVTVAAGRARPNELVLVDRFGTDVLTFIDVPTAQVRAQLPIGTGFEANPQDYLEIDEHKAYVPRLGENKRPNSEPFDAGSDVLLIDPAVPEILGSLPLPRVPGYLPSPAALTRVGDALLVTLQHIAADFSGMADGEVFAASVEDEAVRYRLLLRGLQNCGRVEQSPNGRLLAVACTSYVDRNGNAPNLSGSGIVLLDAGSEPPAELQRFAAAELVSGPIQSSIRFVSDRVLLFKTQTAVGAGLDNQLLALDLETSSSEVLATAARNSNGTGYGIAFGGLVCAPGCGDPCFMADLSRGVVQRFAVEGDGVRPDGEVDIHGAGLPPTDLTPFW